MSRWQKVFSLIICLLLCSNLFGCDHSSENSNTTVVTTPDGEGTVNGDNIVINLPQASGSVVYSQSGCTIDASNTKDGYVMVKCSGYTEKLKVKVSLGDQSYTYDLNNQGNYEVYPLQMGNGAYSVKVYKNLEGTSYSVLYSVSLNVSMDNTDRVFVFPNQYVWYTNDDDAIALSQELCKGVSDNAKKADIIYNYIVKHISYDDEKAKTVQSGYLPDVDSTLSTGKGICFDYAALMASMLRAHDIPTKLVIGNLSPENIYHAWNQVYINGEWVWMDPTLGKKNTHEQTDYTEERKY